MDFYYLKFTNHVHTRRLNFFSFFIKNVEYSLKRYIGTLLEHIRRNTYHLPAYVNVKQRLIRLFLKTLSIANTYAM